VVFYNGASDAAPGFPSGDDDEDGFSDEEADDGVDQHHLAVGK